MTYTFEQIRQAFKDSELSGLADLVIKKLGTSAEQTNKLSPEQRFEEIINGLVIKIDKGKYPNSIFFFKNDKCLFELENSTLWCSFSNVWSIFSEENNMNYDATQEFIKIQMEKHFKMKDVTPISPKYNREI